MLPPSGQENVLRTKTHIDICCTYNSDSSVTMQGGGGEESQAGFTADSDAGSDSFGSAEEA